MVAMRVLTTFLSVLIVANARVIRPEGVSRQPEFPSTNEQPEYPSTTEQQEYPSTTEEPEYPSTTGEPEYPSTTEQQEYPSTTEQPQYTSSVEYPTTGYYFGNDSFTTDYNPEIFTVQCGISQDSVFYLDALENSRGTFEIFSNTTEDTNYSNNVDCRVQFRTGADPVGFSVVIENLDLENSTSCGYDYLCIKGAKFCGKSTYSNYLYYVVPSNNTLTLKFHTDSSVTASGFKVTVYSWKTESYYSSYEPYGIISNPNYIANYHEVSQSNYVDYCNNEYDQVYYGTSPSYYQTTPDYYSTDSSNGGVEQVIECNSGNTDNYYYLDSYNNNNRYVLRSDNFGNGNYGTNTNCKVKFFTSSVRQRLAVYYSSFDLERTNYCGFDSLCVNGVKYCSDWLSGSTYYYEIPAYNSFSVNFVTDGSVSRSGFEAHLTFENANNYFGSYGSYEATSGDGSAQYSVVYSDTDDYSYQDRCASDYTSSPTSYYDAPSSTAEPRIDFGDSAILQSYVNVIKSNVDEAATHIGVVKDLIDSLPSTEE